MSQPKLTRRDFFKLGGSLAAASLLAACAPEETLSVPGSPTAQSNIPVEQTAVPLPLVSLPIIALSRMSFGIRPGDLEAFLALGSTDEERLQAYVEG